MILVAHGDLECEWRKIKGKESIGGIKKRLRNSTWIGERISLNWIKVYGFGQSSLLSLLRLCRMLILFLYWHWHFKLFSVDISWQVITQSCKLLGIFEGKKNSLCFYTNVPSLNKLEEYVNFTDCLKIWPEDYQDTNQKKLEKWISTRACDVMCIGKILISKLDRQVSKHPIRILKKFQHSFEDQPIRMEVVQRFYLCSQIWYAINSLKETLSISNCPASFGLQLDQA